MTFSITTLSVNRLLATLSIMTLSITYYYDECHYDECRILVIVMLNVIMLNVVILSVVAPKWLTVISQITYYSLALVTSVKGFILLALVDRQWEQWKEKKWKVENVLKPPNCWAEYQHLDAQDPML